MLQKDRPSFINIEVISIFIEIIPVKHMLGVPVVEQWKQIQLGTMRLQDQTLVLLSGLRIQLCCELWCRPAATARMRPLAWEPPYAVGAALKNKKKQKKKEKKRKKGRKEHFNCT